MATVVTKELALSIAEKLGAVKHPGKNRPHDLYVIYHGETRVAQFGIRRASQKDKGHDHVPAEIHLSPRKARLLGQCPMSKEEWVAEMTEKGFVVPSE
jgi:hypothetical protein